MPDPKPRDDQWDLDIVDYGPASEDVDLWALDIDDPSGASVADADAVPDLVTEAQQEGGWSDFALGALDGLLLNYGSELGSLFNDEGGVDPFEDAAKTKYGNAGRILGNITTGLGVGAATGGGSLIAQAGIQGVMGALSGYGREHDIGDAAIGGTVSAILGGGGAALSKAAAPAAQLDDAEQAYLSYLQQHVTKDGTLPQAAAWASKLLGEGVRRMGAGRVGGWMAENAAKRFLTPSAVAKLTGPDPKAVAQISGELMPWLGGVSQLTGNVLTARPDTATIAWALQSVNASGDTGLPPKAQQRLNEALASDSDDAVSSVYMSLSMAYPAFQKRMQAEIESTTEAKS